MPNLETNPLTLGIDSLIERPLGVPFTARLTSAAPPLDVRPFNGSVSYTCIEAQVEAAAGIGVRRGAWNEIE